MLKFALFSNLPNIEHGITERGEDTPVVVRGEQVHGDKSAWVETDAKLLIPKVDALLARQPGFTLGVVAADCVPVLLCEPGMGIIGTIHAGWRGTALDVTRKTIEALKTKPFQLRVGIGPAICPNCFEVGEEVARQFDRSLVRESENEEGKWHVDLWQANVNQCLELGVPERNIEVMRVCTFENHNLFSYRRGDRNERHTTWIRRTK
jgi:YfiH family protein